jgi:signal transduction histidine kinase
MTPVTTSSPTGYPDIETQLKHYERLIEISKQLNSTFDHRALLKQIISAATELTDTEEASIMLLDPTTGELRFEIATNMSSTAMQEIVVPLEGSVAGWIFTHGEPRVIQDLSQERTHSKVVDDATGFKSRNLLGVPMRTHKKVIGVLEALNKHGGVKFTEADMNVLTTLAGLAAIAIENARLFQQSDFIAEMVHELRTPLLALKASTSLLLRPELPVDRRMEMVETMQEETNRLMRLTTDFLDLAQMESGRARLDIAPIDLPRLLAESAEVVKPQAEEKNIRIVTDTTPYVVSADRGKVKQVLLNLMTNAIKYNRRDGKIHVRATLEQDGDRRMVQIAVADTGFGISKENQKRMFEKFFRIKETSGQATGTGLGLVITKHIVEVHSGSIWLESEEGVGTTFYFTLPLSE